MSNDLKDIANDFLIPDEIKAEIKKLKEEITRLESKNRENAKISKHTIAEIQSKADDESIEKEKKIDSLKDKLERVNFDKNSLQANFDSVSYENARLINEHELEKLKIENRMYVERERVILETIAICNNSQRKYIQM